MHFIMVFLFVGNIYLQIGLDDRMYLNNLIPFFYDRAIMCSINSIMFPLIVFIFLTRIFRINFQPLTERRQLKRIRYGLIKLINMISFFKIIKFILKFGRQVFK